ncbi:MAG: IclR family transcriptional regulator [Spirochaetota bacterium]
MLLFKKIHSIFQLLKQHYRTGLTNKEISTILNIPPSTCYRILAFLKKNNYVYQRKADSRYFLGFAHLPLAEAVVEGTNEAAICLPFLEEIHYETEEIALFALYTGNHCVVMEILGHINTRAKIGRGEIMPMHCAASGKVVLAFLPVKEQKRIMSELDYRVYTPYTNTKPAVLKKELAKIYKTGVSYNHQELDNETVAVAAPIFNSKNHPIGSIALVGSTIDMGDSQLEEYAKLLVNASINISTNLRADYPQWIKDYWKE